MIEQLRDPFEKKVAVNPWPEDQDQAEKKTTAKRIGSLINSLVLHVSLAKHARNLGEDFPGLETIRKEAESAKVRAIKIMKGLLQEWEQPVS